MKSKSVTIQDPLYEPSGQPYQPHDYQKRAIRFLLEHACAALFLDPGLGKTSITLAALKILEKKGMGERTLIIAPLRVCHNVWPGERQRWTDFHGFKMVVLHGPDKDDLIKEPADIYVINPEGLDWLLGVTTVRNGNKVSVSTDLKKFKALKVKNLVVDELSKFKHTNTVRFKAIKQVLGQFKRRWGLTGSPAANGLMDLFGQCYILDQGQALGQYITHYRTKYFVPGFDGFSWNLQEGAEELIYKRLAPLALRMSAEDHLDIPELIVNPIKVDLPKKARQIYDHMENDLIAKIENRVVVANNAGVASGKCRQVASGGLYLDPEVAGILKTKADRESVVLHDAKTDALEDLIDELQGSPLLVAYEFNHDLERLQKRFGKDLPYIGGGVSSKRAKELEDLWNRGKLPYLFGHPQSIAHGLNLQFAGHHVCWYTLTWDYELYDQFNRRVRRQGNSHSRVFVHQILARDTIDDQVIRHVLNAKDNRQAAFFEAIKNLNKFRKSSLRI